MTLNIVGYIRPPTDIKETRAPDSNPDSIPEDEAWQYRINDRWVNLRTKQRFICLGYVPVDEGKERLLWREVEDDDSLKGAVS